MLADANSAPNTLRKEKMFAKLKIFLAVLVTSSLPLIAIAPASAAAIDRLNIIVDCDTTQSATGENDHNIAPGDVLTINYLNCSGVTIWDNDSTGNAALPGGIVIDDSESQLIATDDIDVTVDGEADLEIDNLLISSSVEDDIDIFVAGVATDPASTLLATKRLRFGFGVSDMMIREADVGLGSDSGSGGAYLNGIAEGEGEPGSHIYEALEIEVATSGTFDFRTINASPLDEDLFWQADKYPSGDPVMVLYDSFDPLNPESNIVGCNANSDVNVTLEIDSLWNGGEDSLETGAGFVVDNQWPWFRVELESGNYTLVNMSYNTFSSADFDAGQYGATSDESFATWTPTAQTNTVEIWGPEDGLAVDEPLAPTGGVEPAFALWAGLGVVGIGVAMTVARRREQRA